MRVVYLLALAGCLASPALARDRTGFKAIEARDYAAAEKVLLNERRIFPSRPELMINLGTVYARTGRLAEADGLYRAALDAEAVEMALPDGAIATSHDVARRGLRSLAPTTLAVR
ncbi:tetratricopeptide repeat protein [Sphingomonas sp.]|jgi:Flp pilus assembly protein TadD|uniref:tetratricopeptide repeat protein n=1 Tax=Sphingomonas sp. TaxID=28214 RepID=UPI00262E92D9|nr:tetratricopeptide repeat protein [Sphingomonas sp.]MDF2603388.1 hypothetical protein [Sphingomonas sp.]